MTWILKINSPSDPARVRYYGKLTFPVSDALQAMAFASEAEARQQIESLRESGFSHLLEPMEVPPDSGLAYLMKIKAAMAGQ